MKRYTIVAGWYKRHKKQPTIRELKIIIDSSTERTKDQLQHRVAYAIGRRYPSKIDFSFFDITEEEL